MMPLIAKKEIAQERYNICKSCPAFTSALLCSKCNCFMPVKVKLAMVSCPVGKWLPLTNIEHQQSDPYENLK